MINMKPNQTLKSLRCVHVRNIFKDHVHVHVDGPLDHAVAANEEIAGQSKRAVDTGVEPWHRAIYYQLAVEGGDVVYTSEKLPWTMNPSWLPIDVERITRAFIPYDLRLLMHVDLMVFQIQRLSDEKFECVAEIDQAGAKGPQAQGESILKQRISFCNLIALKTDLINLPILPMNTILLEFEDGLYIDKDFWSNDVQKANFLRTWPILVPARANDPEKYDQLRGMQNIREIMKGKRKLEDARKKLITVKEKIITSVRQENLRDVEDNVARDLREEIKKLQYKLIVQRHILDRRMEAMELETSYIHDASVIQESTKYIREQQVKVIDDMNQTKLKRFEVISLAHSIRMRQAYLVTQLSVIYPIGYDGTSGEYHIRKMRLNQTDLLGKDEEEVATALGYTAHLVFMLSKYLLVPLRYRIVPFSSRSFIRDEVRSGSSLAEYPLFRKSVEKEKFERGVFFLKKDIEQILSVRGLRPTSNAPLLASLKKLMETETSWLSQNNSN